MSMYRQLWLAIILSMSLALAGSLLTSLVAARAYLEQQLSIKNADNASALALSLSQQNLDAVAVELTVAAMFDKGHYESIRIHDPHGKPMIALEGTAGKPNVPTWFVQSLPINPDPGVAQITSGWKQFGTVTLRSNSRFGYEALWSSTKTIVAALTLATLISGYLGSLILRRLRRPLQAVIDQAKAITDRRFISIPEPDVPELRQLAIAMNMTVARLNAMFHEEAARLETLRRKANLDPLTGLANREFFISRLRSSLEGENSTGGTLLLIRVADLAGINRRLGREATDDLLRRIGETVGDSGAANTESLAGRMNGADFALLLPGQTASRAVAEILLQALIKTMGAFVDGGPSAYIGMGTFKQGTGLRELLSQTDVALIAAEAEGASAIREAAIETDAGTPRTAEEWSQIITRAVDQHWLRLVSFPVVDMQGRLLHVDCPLRLKCDAAGEWLPAGRFLPVAERLGLSPKLDLAALAMGLAELEQQPSLKGLGINLSAGSMAAAGFHKQLDTLLARHRRVAARLWIGVTETGALKHLETFRSLCTLLRSYGCQVGVEHFGRHFSQIGQLHDLGLNYIKVDASFTRRLDTNPGNQAFLKGISSIAHNIGLLVIAEGTASESELALLTAVGFDGATGPGMKVADHESDQ